MAGYIRKIRNAAASSIWATSIDCDRSPACPSRSASSRRRRLTARAGRRVAHAFAPSSATRLSAAERSFSSFTCTSSPSTPSACHGVWPVIRALASASLIRQKAHPSPISLAAIRASGTPRPPDRFIATRSRKAPMACLKSRCRLSTCCLSSRSGSMKKKMAAKTRPAQTGTMIDRCTPASPMPSRTMGAKISPNRPSRTLVAR